MDKFEMFSLAFYMNEIDTHDCFFSAGKIQGKGAVLVTEGQRAEIYSKISVLKSFFWVREMGDCMQACESAMADIQNSLVDYSSAQANLHQLKRAIMLGLEKRKFLYVKDDRCEFIDHPALFGDLVCQSFPSSARDIHEAGNCLSVECCTAAVFHLMRASEFALRALARDRQVEFSDKPLEDKQWGEILPNLASKIKELSESPLKSWENPSQKEPQVRFYSEAVQELRGFNDAWRRHVAHADADAFYNRESAYGILIHVRSFMQKLAVKISESAVTEKQWK